MLGALTPDVVLWPPWMALDEGGHAGREAFLPAARVVRFAPTTIEDVLDDVLRIGGVVGRMMEATRAVVSLRERMASVQERVNAYEDGPRVTFLVGVGPLRAAGGWIAQLVERAGGRHLMNPVAGTEAVGGGLHPEITGAEIACAGADAVVVCLEGRSLAEAEAAAKGLREEAWWNGLTAVRAGRVMAVDGRRMFHRAGPGLVESFEWLRAWLEGSRADESWAAPVRA